MANTFIVEYVGDDENKCFRNYVKTLDVVDRPTRGDLVRMVPEDEYDKYSVWSDYYRNEHMSIVNKWGDLEELDYTIDDYGALPSSYRLYEEDDYFKQSHWVREGEPLFGHAHYLWLTNEGLLDKCKYLVPKDIHIREFLCLIRKRIKIDSKKAIFIFINNKLVPMSSSLIELYNSEKDEDGFLYIKYTLENTFG
jgi:hypothetical protein